LPLPRIGVELGQGAHHANRHRPCNLCRRPAHSAEFRLGGASGLDRPQSASKALNAGPVEPAARRSAYAKRAKARYKRRYDWTYYPYWRPYQYRYWQYYYPYGGPLF
jgi:hypothetical protein